MSVQGVSDEARRAILSHIDAIEHEFDVKVLYAVESGSRAWGFESPDSDYDVRFIYQESPRKLLNLYERRDVIEVMLPPDKAGPPVEVDLVGWSVKKTLKLGAFTNAQIAEWATGPVIYRADAGFSEDMRLLAGRACPRKLVKSYQGLAKGIVKGHLKGAHDPVAKKYLYAVRSVLASRWVAARPKQGSTPPVRLEDLLRDSQVPVEASRQITELLDLKGQAGEAEARMRFEHIDAWLESELGSIDDELIHVERHFVDPDVVRDIWWRSLPAALQSALDMSYMDGPSESEHLGFA